MGPGGTMVYQMPQGVVYTPPDGSAAAPGQQMVFGIDPNTSQFITIPVPISLHQVPNLELNELRLMLVRWKADLS